MIQRRIPGVGTLYFEYDLAGRRTMVQDWTGAAVYYDYGKRGLISEVHSDAGWTYYAYDARGAMLVKELPNGTVTYHSYDAAGRVTAVEDRKTDGTAITTFAFTRDPNANILTSLREDGSCWYYDYDGLQRLTQAEWKDDQGASLYGYEYNYDKVGNRASLAASGVSTYYSYNAANELTDEVTLGVETAYYTYDGRGNQTQRKVLGGDTLYFDYNSRNLITRIDSTEDGFTPNSFEYNALGQRTKKVDSTGSTRYVWDGLNIIAEYDEEGTIQRRYTHGHTSIHGVFSLIAVQDAQGCRYCYHLDQVGGVHRLTDAWGNIIKSYEFSPFGRVLTDTGTAPSPFVFPGTCLAMRDLSGWALSPGRPYASDTGRYSARDPAGAVPEYRGFWAAPLDVVDPSGLDNVRLDIHIVVAKPKTGRNAMVFILRFYADYQVERRTGALWGLGSPGPWVPLGPIGMHKIAVGKGEKLGAVVEVGRTKASAGSYLPLAWILKAAKNSSNHYVPIGVTAQRWADIGRKTSRDLRLSAEERIAAGVDRTRHGKGVGGRDTLRARRALQDLKEGQGIQDWADRVRGKEGPPTPTEVLRGFYQAEGLEFAAGLASSLKYSVFGALLGLGSGMLANALNVALNAYTLGKDTVDHLKSLDNWTDTKMTWDDLRPRLEDEMGLTGRKWKPEAAVERAFRRHGICEFWQYKGKPVIYQAYRGVWRKW